VLRWSLTKIKLLKHCFVDCIMRDSQFRSGYLACNQNLPQLNFFPGLFKVAMNENCDVHCCFQCLHSVSHRYAVPWRSFYRRCLMPWYFHFSLLLHSIRSQTKQFCSISCFRAYLGLGDTHALRRDIANQALNFTLHKMRDKSSKLHKWDWNWNIIVVLLSMVCQVSILDFYLWLNESK